MGKNNEVLPAVPEVAGKLKEGTQQENLKSGSKEGKGKLIESNKLLDSKISSYDSGGSGLSGPMFEYFGIDVKKLNQEVGEKETGRRKKYVQMICMIKEAREFRKVQMSIWYQQSL